MLGVDCRPLGLGRWLLVLAVRIVSEKWTGLDFSYKGINLSLLLLFKSQKLNRLDQEIMCSKT